MYKSSIYNENYRPLLSGHETFPLRYGWLKKAFDAVQANESKRSVFATDSAIAKFGVGKNMVASMKHWAIVAGIIAEDSTEKRLVPTRLGCFLFDDQRGIDPLYGEFLIKLDCPLESMCAREKNDLVLGF